MRNESNEAPEGDKETEVKVKYVINSVERLAASGKILTRSDHRAQTLFETVKGLMVDLTSSNASIMVLTLFFQVLLTSPACWAQSKGKQASYPVMAPLSQYLIQDKAHEIALARSAAPPSISNKAEVMVLERTGYKIAVKGTNGFVCIVERSWATSTGDPEFWNPGIRAPICFNPAAARSFLPIYLKKTGLVLAGESKSAIARAISSAFGKKKLPPLEPGAMCYMMSKQQYLNDQGKAWHPHLMFFVAGDVAKSWGANLPGSPVLASNDPQERATVFMVLVGKWSDGTQAPPVVR